MEVVEAYVKSLFSSGIEKLKATMNNVISDVFTAVTMKNAVFWDIKPSFYFTGVTLRPRNRAQPVDVM
jgi:hypothetical protein